MSDDSEELEDDAAPDRQVPAAKGTLPDRTDSRRTVSFAAAGAGGVVATAAAVRRRRRGRCSPAARAFARSAANGRFTPRNRRAAAGRLRVVGPASSPGCYTKRRLGAASPTSAVKIERLNPMEGLRRILLARDAESLAASGHGVRLRDAGDEAPSLIEGALSATMRSPTFFAAGQRTRGRPRSTWAIGGRCGWAALFHRGVRRRAPFVAAQTAHELRGAQARAQGGGGRRDRSRSPPLAASRACCAAAWEGFPEADFVVVNPQHVAVALAYRPPRIAVPEVLVRGAGGESAAMRVRGAGREAIAFPVG